MTSSLYKDKAWLYQHYWGERWCVRKIAEYCGVGLTTIAKQMKKAGIRRRTRSEARRGDLHPDYGKRGPANPRYGRKRSEETRKKISEANKIRFQRERHPMLGRHHSAATRVLIGERGRGRKQSVETIAKRAAARRGKPRPPFSDEWRSHISLAMKRLWQDNAYRTKMSQGRSERSRKFMRDNPERLKKLLLASRACPSRPEKAVGAMAPANILYTGNRSKWFALPNGRLKNPDFEVSGTNKVVEVFGDYWHRNDDPADLIEQYRQIGIECLVLWEHEIKHSPDLVKQKLVDFSAPS